MSTLTAPHPTTDAAYAAFVQEHGLRLYRLAYLLCGSAADADDITQDSLVRLYAAWPRVRPEGALAYSRRIVARQASNWRRRPAARETPHDTVAEPRTPTASGDADGIDGLREAIQQLPPRQRAVVVLRYYDDLSEAAIADALGISVGTVKSQLSRATATLRRLLTPEPEPSGVRHG